MITTYAEDEYGYPDTSGTISIIATDANGSDVGSASDFDSLISGSAVSGSPGTWSVPIDGIRSILDGGDYSSATGFKVVLITPSEEFSTGTTPKFTEPVLT